MESVRLEIVVENTAADYRRVFIHLYRVRWMMIGVIYLLLMSLVLWLTLFGAGANPFEEKKNSVIWVMLIFAILPIVIAASIALKIRKQTNIIAKTLEPTVFVFSNDGLATTAKSSSVNVLWNTIQRVRELKEDFLFYPQENIFYVVPKRFFQSELQIQRFRELVLEQLGSKAKLRKQ